MWYENSTFIGTLAMLIIACWAMFVMGVDAKDVVIPIVAAIAGFITGKNGKGGQNV